MNLKRVLCAALATVLLAIVAAPIAFATEEVSIVQTGSWQQVEFRWAGDADEFNWQVYRVEDDALVPVPLHESFATQLAQNGLLVLSLRATEPLFGRFKVSLIVDGIVSAPRFVWLLRDGELQAALAQARYVAQNPNGRYCAEYIVQLQAAIAAAQALYAADEVTPTAIAAQVALLNSLSASPELSMTNNGFFNRFVPSWWRAVDIVATPFRWLQTRTESAFPMVRQIFTAMFEF